MSVEIRGSGLVASMLRSLVRGMNVKRRISSLVTNEACLPRANKLAFSSLALIYGTYLCAGLMLWLQAYTERTRRLFAAFFYRKREKRRVLYLYNETLRRRVGYLRFARARLARLARAHLLVPEARIFLTLRLRYPRYCGWLWHFECARQKCSICGEVEPRTRGSPHQVCPNSGCFAIYCVECWRDVGESCLACSAGSPATSSHEEDLEDDEWLE